MTALETEAETGRPPVYDRNRCTTDIWGGCLHSLGFLLHLLHVAREFGLGKPM